MEYSLNMTFVKYVHSNTGNYINHKPDLFKNLNNFQMGSLWQSWFPIKAILALTMDVYTTVLEILVIRETDRGVGRRDTH